MYMTNLAAGEAPPSETRGRDALAALYARRAARRRTRPRPCSARWSRASSTNPPSPRCWSRSRCGRDHRRADRRRPRAARRRRRLRAARLSVRRQLRHRRRRVGDDQPLHRGRLRRGRGRAAGRQAWQSLGHLALRLGRRAGAALGVRLDVAPGSRRAARSTRPASASCSRRLIIPGLRHAGPVRRALKVRTIMNMLGPCVNPAEPPVQLLGVAEERLLEPVARMLGGAWRRAGAGRPRRRARRDRAARRDRGGAADRRRRSSG